MKRPKPWSRNHSSLSGLFPGDCWHSPQRVPPIRKHRTRSELKREEGKLLVDLSIVRAFELGDLKSEIENLKFKNIQQDLIENPKSKTKITE
jgi:hypothetical protein